MNVPSYCPYCGEEIALGAATSGQHVAWMCRVCGATGPIVKVTEAKPLKEAVEEARSLWRTRFDDGSKKLADDKRTCAFCGKTFLVGEATGKRSNTKYCSPECRAEADRIRSRERKRRIKKVKPVYNAVCKVCGDAFEYEYNGRPRKYCSEDCRVSGIADAKRKSAKKRYQKAKKEAADAKA